MADEVIWDAGDTFYLSYELFNGASPSIDWQNFIDPPAPETGAPDPGRDYDQAVSGYETGTILYRIQSGNGVSGNNEGYWDARSATVTFTSPSDWNEPTPDDIRLVADATIQVVFFAHIQTPGSGTGSADELVAANAITSVRDVLNGTETLSFGPDPRLVPDTTFILRMEITQFSYTKDCYANDPIGIVPNSCTESFTFAASSDGQIVDSTATGELASFGNITYTVQNVDGYGGDDVYEGNTTQFQREPTLSSKTADSATLIAGDWPHIAYGSGNVVHRGIRAFWNSVNVAVSVTYP